MDVVVLRSSSCRFFVHAERTGGSVTIDVQQRASKKGEVRIEAIKRLLVDHLMCFRGSVS